MRNVLWMAALLVACGSSVSETRIAYFPPREPACPLDLIQVDPMNLGPWELIGYVSIAGATDPMSAGNRAIVRPRACAMGGEAITLIMGQAPPGGGSGVTYGVLRPRPPPGEAEQAF